MLPDAFRRGQRPFVLAHRGASAAAPENTEMAFRLAIELGADGVELDVQRCASGETVVVHDEDLGRLAGQPVGVARAPWSVLRGLDVGSWFHPRFSYARLLTLPETLEVLGSSALVNVELKGPDDRALVEAVARTLSEARSPDRFVVSSFNARLLGRFQVRAQRLPPGRRPAAGLLFEPDQRLALQRARLGRILRVASLHPAQELCRARRMAGWTRAGYSVVPWTVDEAASAEALWEAGAAGLITNRPLDLLAAFGRPGRRDVLPSRP